MTLAALALAADPGFWVRPGYKLELVAEGIGETRFLEVDRDRLYVSQPGKGKIVSLKRKGAGYEALGDFVTGFPQAHGMHLFDGWLWFSARGVIAKARDTNGDGKADEVVKVVEGLPINGHWWRSVFVTPTAFYTSIGDSGNITDETGTDRQKIWRYSLDGKSRTQFASGLRNTEKLRFRPGTTDLYGADHGSDWFGQKFGDKQGDQPVTDENPPCEFNLYTEGGFYGHPFVVGNRVPRPEYQDRADIHELANRTISPAWSFGAHWAPNGFAFATTDKVIGKGNALVALHGSWNSSRPVGYRFEEILFDEATGRPMGSRRIVGTVDSAGKPNGRPVDVAEEPDGSLLLSEDGGNRIFRLRKTK
jgi:glucose/arabinose dehydrogenase